MQYNLKSLLIILLITPIKYFHIALTGADPFNIVYPLLSIIASVILAFVMKINILNQFIIAISSIFPTLLVSFGTMGASGEKDMRKRSIIIMVIQVILQTGCSLMLYNGMWSSMLASGLWKVFALIIFSFILPIGFLLLFLDGFPAFVMQIIRDLKEGGIY